MTSLPAVALLALVTASGAAAAITNLSCVITAVPALIRLEGLSERLGDINFSCTGTPGGEVSGSLQLFLPINITNRISPAGALDAIMTVDLGAGPVSAGATPKLASNGSIVFESMSFTLSASGAAGLRITNLRAAAGGLAERPIQAFLAGSGGPSAIQVQNNTPTVAIAQRGLLAGNTSNAIVCQGASLPDVTSLSSLVAAGARLVTARVTEGAAEAFQPRQPLTDAGVRVIVKYSGFPPGARLIVPDVVAGSSAVEPTSGGELGLPASGGKHAPGGTGSLLLARVIGTDDSGAGGVSVFVVGLPGSGTVSFDATRDVTLSGGAGVAVYEVVDSSPATRESAQIPTFLGIPPITSGDAVLASMTVSFGPVSTIGEASAAAPIPRFLDLRPPLDCTVLSDCGAVYFPRLLTDNPPFSFTAQAGSGFQIQYLRINNGGGGVLNWAASVTYRVGTGWIRIMPATGLNAATIRIDILPGALAQGSYEAVLTLDAGPVAGSRTFPINLQITAAPPPAPAPGPGPAPSPPPAAQPPVVRSVVNAATFRPDPLVAGSIGTIDGERLGGVEVRVTLDGIAARLLFVASGQINFVVPPELWTQSSAVLLVIVDGVSSVPQVIRLAVAAPGIFRGGVLNQDNSVNSETNPALVDSILQVFATGLPIPSVGRITAKIHDREIEEPLYGGPAPGLDGVQQVNFAVPGDLPAMTTEILLCGVPVDAPTRRLCGPPATITIRR